MKSKLIILLFMALTLHSCHRKNVEIDRKPQLIGTIDSMTINRVSGAHYFNRSSFTYYMTIYNEDTTSYNILLPISYYTDLYYHATMRPHLWLLSNFEDTCIEAVIINYFTPDTAYSSQRDTLIKLKDRYSFVVKIPDIGIPNIYNMHEILLDFEEIISDEFYFKMLNFVNLDTILFLKADNFCVKYSCDHIEFSPNDSIQMNERLEPPEFKAPPGNFYLSKKTRSAPQAPPCNCE